MVYLGNEARVFGVIRYRMKKLFRVEQSGLQVAVRQARIASHRGKEICGLLINEGSHIRLLPVRNATDRLGGFEVKPSWCRASLRANAVSAGKIIGMYHSHPQSSAEPGPGDIAGTWNGAYMLIIADWGERARLWQVRDDKAFSIGLVVQ